MTQQINPSCNNKISLLPVTSIHALADLMIKRGHVLLFQETTWHTLII